MTRVLQEAKEDVYNSRKLEQDYQAEKEAWDAKAKKMNARLQVCVRPLVSDIPN